MSDLVKVEEMSTELLALQQLNTSNISRVISTTGFARINLFSPNSDACKKGRHELIGAFGVIDGEEITALGKEFDCLIIAARFKALDIHDLKHIVTSYDQESEIAQRIIKDSETKDSGCMYGPELLVYVPQLKDFFNYYLASKSARYCWRHIEKLIKKPACFYAQYMDKAVHPYFAPSIKPSQVPFDLPPTEEILKRATKFLRPDIDGADMVEGTDRVV